MNEWQRELCHGCAEACTIAPIKQFWYVTFVVSMYRKDYNSGDEYFGNNRLNALLYFAERDASPLKPTRLRAANLE